MEECNKVLDREFHFSSKLVTFKVVNNSSLEEIHFNSSKIWDLISLEVNRLISNNRINNKDKEE